MGALAESIDIAMRAGTSKPVRSIQPVPRTEPMPLSFAQQRLWFLDHLKPDNTAYNIFQAMRLNGRIDMPALEQTFTEIVRRHESLRARFLTVEGSPVQVIDEPRPVRIDVTDFSHLDEGERGDEARDLALKETHKPFDLASGPLFRVHMIRLAEDDHIALFTMHHIISDGWSWPCSSMK